MRPDKGRRLLVTHFKYRRSLLSHGLAPGLGSRTESSAIPQTFGKVPDLWAGAGDRCNEPAYFSGSRSADALCPFCPPASTVTVPLRSSVDTPQRGSALRHAIPKSEKPPGDRRLSGQRGRGGLLNLALAGARHGLRCWCSSTPVGRFVILPMDRVKSAGGIFRRSGHLARFWPIKVRDPAPPAGARQPLMVGHENAPTVPADIIATLPGPAPSRKASGTYREDLLTDGWNGSVLVLCWIQRQPALPWLPIAGKTRPRQRFAPGCPARLDFESRASASSATPASL